MKKIIKIMVYILSLCVLSGVSFSQDITCSEMISQSTFSKTDLVKDVVGNFCDKFSSKKCVDNGEKDYFDSNQSIFLTLLCENVGKGESFTGVVRLGENSILLKTGFSQFGITAHGNLGMGKDNCDYKNSVSMNRCNLAEHLPKMFNEIMNDFFNVAQAKRYGIDGLKEELNLEKFANEFSKNNYMGLMICNSDDEWYEESCDYLKGYIQNANNLLKETKVLNMEKIKEFDCKTDGNKNIIYCGLLGNGLTPEYDFLDLVYNEYFWYNLFMNYYSYNLSTNHELSEKKTDNKFDKINDNMQKVYMAKEQLYSIKKAMKISFMSLGEISSSFPIHIGFRMYQEDAKMFMKELSKLYPPIRTLYDKLRNVQIPD